MEKTKDMVEVVLNSFFCVLDLADNKAGLVLELKFFSARCKNLGKA
jgi:hypothetical protein